MNYEISSLLDKIIETKDYTIAFFGYPDDYWKKMTKYLNILESLDLYISEHGTEISHINGSRIIFVGIDENIRGTNLDLAMVNVENYNKSDYKYLMKSIIIPTLMDKSGLVIEKSLL